MRRTIKTFLILNILILLIFLTASAEEKAFELRRIGNLISFEDNAFAISAAEPGSVTVRIHDDISVYRELCFEFDKGDSTVHWDGCGYNRERLSPKNYTITAVFTGKSGKEEQLSFNTPVEYSGQSLQYVLPSSDQVFLEACTEWFVEFKTIQKGNVIFEFSDKSNSVSSVSFQIATTGGKLYRVPFDRLTGRQTPEPGSYHIRAWESSKAEEIFEFDLTVQEGIPEKLPVTVTGSFMPEEGMSDDEIWKIMQQPSVIVDIDFYKHQTVFTEKNTSSVSLGTLHGQTQAVNVIRIEDEWALIGAWNHEEAEYVEGWVPLSVLKTIRPEGDYGILIDKKKQCLTVFYRGKALDRLSISSGLPEKKHLEQETAAGVFLTGYHRVDFSMNGKKFDYVIQYDGGNMMHQIPYRWGKNLKDFRVGRDVLGQKASHACIRVQAEPGDGGLNAYWLWTHIPYRTKLIILDDPEERHALYDELRSSY